jgi:membrane-bound acyltransferase YfiQ involved in biofilm formation
MARRISTLGVLAIFAVVFHHAAVNWDIHAIFAIAGIDSWSTSWAAHSQRSIREITLFAVPSFLAISGFFVAYASRSSRADSYWLVVNRRIANLAIPYLVWQTVYFLGSRFISGNDTPIERVLSGVLLGNNISGYYFVPLLIQLYLLAPWLIRIAKANGPILLAGSATVQATVLLLVYIPDSPELLAPIQLARQLALQWALFPQWVFYFCLGIMIGLNPSVLERMWSRYGRWFAGATLICAVASIIEAEWYFAVNGTIYQDTVLRPLSSAYAVGCIIILLSSASIKLPFPKATNWLNTQTYGVYLLHIKVMEYLGRVFLAINQRILMGITSPSDVILNAWLVLTLVLLFAFGLAIPLLVMRVVAHSPGKRVYPYLFG